MGRVDPRNSMLSACLVGRMGASAGALGKATLAEGCTTWLSQLTLQS